MTRVAGAQPVRDARRRGRKPRRAPSMAYVGTVNTGIRLLLGSLAHVRIEGVENVPRDGPLIVATNHLSSMDPPVLGAWLIPALGRPIYWLTKEEALAWPLVGPLLARYGCFPLRRGAGDAEAMRVALDLLESGGVLSVFPEGTRSGTGTLARGKPGIAMLALRSGAPILPVAIAGSERLIPARGRLPRPGAAIRLRVGPPWWPRPDPILGHRAALEATTTEVMVHLARLLPPAYRGEYADAARDAGPTD